MMSLSRREKISFNVLTTEEKTHLSQQYQDERARALRERQEAIKDTYQPRRGWLVPKGR